MSLKAFHIVFILVSTAFTIGFGLWGVNAYLAEADRTGLLLGTLSFLSSVALVGYGTWFLKKYRNLSYL